MCKHVAASMYGIGARFDKQPLLLFALRGVDHTELLSEASKAPVGLEIDTGSLSEVFGIEFADENLNVIGSKATAKVKRVASAVGNKPKAGKSKSSKPKISKPKKEVMVKKKTPLKVKAVSHLKTEKQPKKRSTKVEKRVVVRELISHR